MAFETVSGGKYLKSNSIAVGESIEGYVTGKYNSVMYPDKDAIVMLINDEKVTVNTHGSLGYFFKNGNPINFYYKFTRLADKQIKGKASLQWLIQVDKSRKIETPAVVNQDSTESLPF
jgi:hypothetical protein